MRRRLLTSYLALTVLVLAALEIPLGLSYADREREQLQNDLLRDAFTIAAFVEDALEGRENLDMQQLADRYDERTDARVVIVDATGQLVADSDPPVEGERSFAARPEIAEALDRRIATGERRSETLGTGLVYVAVPVGSGADVLGAVRLTYSTDQLDDRVRRYWMLLGGIAAVSLAAAAGVGIVLAKWVTGPIERLRDAATTIGGGDLSARAPTTSGPPELRELAHAFNDTAGRLEHLVDAQEQFVADASHQLRTPLTALRLRLEMLESEVGPDAEDDLAGARAEVRRLSRLVDGLLALARAERTASTVAAEAIDLDELLAERAEAWRPVADERDIVIDADGNGHQVWATRDRIVQVLDNLLANALQATPPTTTITLRGSASTDLLGGQARAAEIHVEDEGPGMSAEQREHAFDRFWRADGSRGDLGGSGLGLAIVQKLVAADGGEVVLEPADPHGLRAVVRLPRDHG